MPKRFVLSDNSLNIYGFRVLTEGIDLSLFKKNPILLCNHNMYNLPIGKWDNLKVENGVLTAEPVFDEIDPDALAVQSKVEQGILNACSIGFRVLETSDDPKYLLKGQTRSTVTKCQLYEVSIVNVPANGNAMKLSFDNGITLSGGMPDEFLNQVLPTFKHTLNMEKVALSLGLPKDANEDAIIAAIDAIRKKDGDKVLSLVIAKGKEKGVIDDTNEAQWRKLFAADFDSTSSLLDAQVSKVGVDTKEVKEDSEKKETGGDVRLSAFFAELRENFVAPKTAAPEKTFDWYSKNDPAALQLMQKAEPKKFGELFKAQYGEEYK